MLYEAQLPFARSWSLLQGLKRTWACVPQGECISDDEEVQNVTEIQDQADPAKDAGSQPIFYNGTRKGQTVFKAKVTIMGRHFFSFWFLLQDLARHMAAWYVRYKRWQEFTHSSNGSHCRDAT